MRATSVVIVVLSLTNVTVGNVFIDFPAQMAAHSIIRHMLAVFISIQIIFHLSEHKVAPPSSQNSILTGQVSHSSLKIKR